MIKKFIGRVVDFSGRWPLLVFFLAMASIAVTWTYASRLDLRSDILELLPRDSPGFKAFEHQLGRVGGGATLIVVVESPDRAANQRLIDDLSAKVTEAIETRKACVKACDAARGDVAACMTPCGPDLIAYAETGSKDVRQFFQDNKWLYADVKDLESADETLDHQIAIGSGLVSDLESDDEPAPKKLAPPRQGQRAPDCDPARPAAPREKSGAGDGRVPRALEGQGEQARRFPHRLFRHP